MTTYTQKKTRMFMERPEWLKPERRRSESRLKTYPSSTDVRNWCDIVEDRRQHILELVQRGYDKCAGKLVPLDVIVDMLLAMANADIAKLKNCLKQLWKFIYGLNLTDDELKKLEQLTTKMDIICKEAVNKDKLVKDTPAILHNLAAFRKGPAVLETDSLSDTPGSCVASRRHLAERASIEKLVKGTPAFRKFSGVFKKGTLSDPPVTKTRINGPGKMVTRIKGPQPGFQVVDDPSNRTHITLKPIKQNAQRMEVPSQDSTEFNNIIPGELQETGNIPPQGSTEGNNIVPGKLEGTDNISPDKLAAAEALCKEQRDKIKALTKERDDLKKKLDACLRELDNFKKIQAVANPSLPASCQQEIEALEAEIKIMRSGNPSPEEEAEIIKKEVEILKRYCSKLKDVENENEKLKVELGSRVAIKDSDFDMDKEKMETLKDKLKNLEDLTHDRDTLANKVHMLEKQLLQYQDLPQDIELLKNRSDMLDSVMQERDNLGQKVKMMKGMEEELQKLKSKADRVDDLERELKNMNKGDRSSGLELRKSKSIADNLESELHNVKSERDAMQKRIDSMKKELDNQKAKVTEAEMLRLERDRLQIKLNELADIQAQYEEMMSKLKIFDTVKAERDMYKFKYEEVLEMECQCEMLKAQVDEARAVSRERDHLQKQVDDLEACICEQEDEIKLLVLQVDELSKTKDVSSNRMNTFKEEMAMKDKLLAESQDKLIQSHTMGMKINELQKLLHKAEHMILQKDCHIKCLQNELNCKTGSINTSKKLNRREMESVELMRKELEAAKAENKRLQEIANKMLSISGDDHVKKMLKQSECAVKRVVEELGRQYKEWDHVKRPQAKEKFATNQHDCTCYSAGEEVSSGDDCEKLRLELEELQKEKRKLEFTVKQLQGEGASLKGSNSICPKSCRR